MHYDNFSHWAVVVKYMLVTDRIPDAASAIIDFKSYPLGSSSFLYYVWRIVGNGEGVMLVAQAMLLFASFYAVFGAIRDQKRFLLAALLGLGCSAMAYFNISIRINNLLVDFLLPALALAVIGVLLVERKKFFTACLAVLPVLGLLTIVKNTGIFFALLGICVLALSLRSGAKRGRESCARSSGARWDHRALAGSADSLERAYLAGVSVGCGEIQL